MRIRCNKGLRINAFFGHFFIRSTDLLALPACDADKVGGWLAGWLAGWVAGWLGGWVPWSLCLSWAG
jgi:hypothetical protein